MQKPTIGAGLILLALSACGAEPARNESAAKSTIAGNSSAPAAAPAPIVLEGAGLRIPSASPPMTLAFDTPKAATIQALTKALGRPPTQLGDNQECGGGGMEFAEWKGEITAWFLDGRFAGWDDKGKLRTVEGIGLGSSRADLAILSGFEVEESTLGTEFRSGGLSGILASKAPGAKVTHFWGGATCVFR